MSRWTIYVERGIWYSNPFNHLKKCVSDNDDGHQTDVYNVRITEMRQQGFASSTSNPCIVSVTKKGKAMLAYLSLAIRLAVPASYVSNPMIRAFAKFDELFIVMYFKETLFKLTALDEKQISNYSWKHRGAIVHDGWKCNGTHFFGMFASYMTKVAVLCD